MLIFLPLNEKLYIILWFFKVFVSGTYLFAIESAKYYDKNFCTLWNQLVKIMTKALSKSLLQPFIFVFFIAKVKVEILHKSQHKVI